MTPDTGIDYVKEQHRFHRLRLRIEWLIITLVFAALLLRAAWMMLVQHEFWLNHRQQRFAPPPSAIAVRHPIVDRLGQPLAYSMPSYAIGWHPTTQKLSMAQKELLSSVVEQPWDEWLSGQDQDKRFIYLKKNMRLPEELQQRLRKVPGIELFPSQKRFYPLKGAGAQLLGFVDYDHQGAEGVERAFDARLQPQLSPQDSSKVRDAKGRWMLWKPQVGVPHSTPKTLQLTIDARIQALLSQALRNAFEKYEVAGFSAIVLDARHGDLLGVASYPSFNPNENEEYGPNRRLKPLLDLYEVGSVMKPFSMATILSQYPEAINFQTRTDPGEIIVQNHPITDVTKRRSFDFEQILIYSSNIALVKALQAYPPKPTLLPGLKGCGLNQRSGLPLEEPAPIFPAKIKAGSLDEATLSFGYTSQLSLMQLARSYLLFAQTHGDIPPLNLVVGEKQPASAFFEPQITPEAREKIQAILERVVQEGSARRAAQKNIRVAGKTGTAKRVGEQGYEERYHAFFVGIFPLDDPQYVLVIHADDPQGQIYGGQICAPVAKNLISQLSILPKIA